MRIFLFAAANEKEDGVLYEITSKGLEKVKETATNYRGDICLMYEPPIGVSKQTANYINVGVHDVTLSDSEIFRENYVKFGTSIENRVFPLNTRKGLFKISVSLKKEVVNKLFMKYEFSKIIPLSLFLWMQGKGVNGIGSSQLSFFKIVTKDYMEAKNIEELHSIIHEQEFAGNIDKDELQVLSDIYQGNLLEENIEEHSKRIFNITILDKELIKNNYYADYSYNNIAKSDFIEKIKTTNFFIEDTISYYYKSKLFKPFFIFGIIILGSISALLFFLNGKTATENYLLENKVAENQKVVEELNKTIQELDKENYIEYIKKPEINKSLIEIKEKLDFLNLQDITRYIITISKPDKTTINFSVKGFEEFEKVEEILKSKNIKYINEAKGNEYSFNINLSLDNSEQTDIKNKNRK